MAKEKTKFVAWAGPSLNGPWKEYHTNAFSENQARLLIRKRYNNEHGRLPEAYVCVENIREIK